MMLYPAMRSAEERSQPLSDEVNMVAHRIQEIAEAEMAEALDDKPVSIAIASGGGQAGRADRADQQAGVRS